MKRVRWGEKAQRNERVGGKKAAASDMELAATWHPLPESN